MFSSLPFGTDISVPLLNLVVIKIPLSVVPDSLVIYGTHQERVENVAKCIDNNAVNAAR